MIIKKKRAQGKTASFCTLSWLDYHSWPFVSLRVRRLEFKRQSRRPLLRLIQPRQMKETRQIWNGFLII